MPPFPVEALYRQLRKTKKFAEDAGEVISDTVLIRSGYNNIENTGLFSHTCYEWCMATTKSCILFQQYFIKHDRDRKKQSMMRDIGFHNVNGASTIGTETETISRGNFTITDVSALTAAITLHTAAKRLILLKW